MAHSARRHTERHRNSRVGWLRAAVLGANDGIVSTASLILGVAAAHADRGSILVSGAAALVAGAMSMAAGEYVSVHSQSDTERADLAREQVELDASPEAEQRELAHIYVGRGLDPALADTVAAQLMQHDALAAHARDELGLSPGFAARPLQAAVTSAASFTAGAAVPLALAALSPASLLVPAVAAGSLVLLAGTGALAAYVGGANAWLGAARVGVWGALAMAVTTGVGTAFDIAV